MPEVKFENETRRFDCTGLDLNRPVDSVKPKKFPYLKNCRTYQAGRLECREGTTEIAEVVPGQTKVHSCRRLNDPLGSAYARIIGTGTHLAYGTTTFTDIDSGYSGNPLALQSWTPVGAPTPYMYVGDSSRMRKITRTGTLDTIGYAPPTTAPTVALTGPPNYKVIDEFDATAGWAAGGTAGAPTLLSAGPGYRTTGTISQILYDTGTTGWACVNLNSMVGVGYGERLTFNPGGGTEEIATVQAVFPGSVATTIAAVIYDSGTTGECSLVLATPIEQVNVDGLIRNATVGPENARIIAVTRGPNGTTSIRISTTNTWAAGNTVQVLASFRAYTNSNHAAAETVRTDGVRTVVTVGTGYISRTVAVDLSLLAAGVATTPDDYMHISLRVDRPDLVTELKVLLDVDSATNDFTRNFYSRTFRASDLTPSVRNQQPLISTGASILQREIIDGAGQGGATSPFTSDQSIATSFGGTSAFVPKGIPGPLEPSTINAELGGPPTQLRNDETTPADSPIVLSQQLESGDVQWTDLTFRLSDLIRVGTDDTRSLQNIAVLRVMAIVTGTVTVDMDSWWAGGGFGPDSGDVTATPYVYRYRVRNPATNVPSNFSPATRLVMAPNRQSVTVTPTQYAAPSGTNITATNLVLDIVRFGGQLPDWHYVGTIPNAASPSFADIYSDDVVAGNPILANDNYQPWPIHSTPVSGTTGTVAGTTINDSSTSFNASWAPGTRVLVNNQPMTLYRVISTSRLELVENAGNQNGVSWRIDDPVIMGQPLPCLWEWDGVFFACGDTTNPGRLYHSNNDSETTTLEKWLDLTPPSEPLMNGLQYNTRVYVFSSESFMQILKTSDPDNPFYHQHIPNGKGLFSRWALTREHSPVIAFLSRDGINITTGGASTSLTDADMYLLFPNEGNIGHTTNGISAPNIIEAQAANLRLSYYDEFLYFDYVGVDSARASLALAFDAGAAVRGELVGGWFWDVYPEEVVFHYGEEGSGIHSLLIGMNDGSIYQYTGYDDNGTAISMEFTVPSLDAGNPRHNKLYGDIMLDCNLAGLTATATPYINNNATALTAVSITNSSRAQIVVPTGSAWTTALNVSLNVVVLVSTINRPFFYIWEPRWTFESAPISAISWEISPSSLGAEGFKHFGLCRVTHVSSVDLDLIFTVDGTAQTPITIANSGGIYAETIFRVPVMKGKIYKLRLASSDGVSEFRLDTRDTFFEVKEWGSDNPYQRMRIFGDYSFIQG